MSWTAPPPRAAQPRPARGDDGKLQESNTKLKSLDELKTQFFANVNHELRTPLTLMLRAARSDVDGQMGKVSAEQRDTLDTIQHNGFKLLKLINNLLDLTKLEEGKMRLKIRTVDFVDFTGSLLASVKPLADRSKSGSISSIRPMTSP